MASNHRHTPLPGSRMRFAWTVTEVIFAALPLLVVGVVMASLGEFGRFLHSPEWAFGACVLFGLSVAKLAAAGRGLSASSGRLALGVAMLVALGLLPALVMLVLVLTAEVHEESVGAGVTVGQVLWFLLSAGTYFVFGGMTESLEHGAG